MSVDIRGGGGGGGAAPVTSVFGRVGVVVGVDTDYQNTGHNLGEALITLDGVLSATTKVSGIAIPGTLGDTIAVGDLCYLATADQRWELADADAEATSGDVILGICLTAGNDGDATTMFVYGTIRIDAWNFTSYGQALFVSTTAGDMTATAPSASGDIVRVVGHAWYTADEIFFNPSPTWTEII